MKKTAWIYSISVLIIIAAIAAVYFYDRSGKSVIKGQPLIESQTESKVPSNPKVTFVIGGDMMFARNISYNFRDGKLVDVVSNLGQSVFTGADLSMINLEGPISKTAIKPDNTKGLMTFNFPPETANVLKWLGISSVSLANNHTNNKGPSGLASTRELLADQNISYIGEETKFNEGSIKEYEFSGKKVSVITINCLEVTADITQAVRDEAAKADYVIVFPHWGVEYKENSHTKDQEIFAHKWIDAGADLVIGSHPHVVEDIEIYKNRPIFYSLGNLLFDQDFSEPTQKGLIVSGTFEDGKLELALLPTISVKYKPQLEVGKQKSARVKELEDTLTVVSSEQPQFINNADGILEKIVIKL